MPGSNLINVSGSQPNGEVWSIGIAFNGGTNGTPISDYGQLLNWVTTIQQDFAEGTEQPEYVAQVFSHIGSGWSVNKIRIEARDETGDLLQAAEASVDYTVDGGSVNMPRQTSMVVSLLTGFPGRSRRGRVYLPYTLSSLASGARFSPVQITPVLTGFAALLARFATASADPDFNAVVWSRKLGTTLPITSIAIGDIPDVQRRRRDALPEIYTTQPVGV